MNKEQAKTAFEITSPAMCNGTILGTLKGDAVCMPVNTRFNNNVIIYGAPGTGKSTTFVLNDVFQSVKRGESLIMTDPSSELYNTTAEYLRSQGYVVKVFNLVRPEHSNSWNCLNEVRGDEELAQLFVNIIITNTSEKDGGNFWDANEMNLLKSLVLFVSTCDGYDKKQKKLGRVYDLLVQNDSKALDNIFNQLKDDNPAKFSYKLYKKGEEKNGGNIQQGLGIRLALFQAKKFRNIMSYDEIDLELPAKKKCAYFVIIPDQHSAYDFLSVLFFSFIFIDITNYASNSDTGKCDVPVNFILDEFPNIGQIPDFTKKLATVRKYDIAIRIIFQNLAQLQNRYPHNLWEDILGNCDTHLFLGCSDSLTADYVSKYSGIMGITVSSKQKNLNTIRISDNTPDFRETSGQGKRYLFNPDEIRGLGENTALVFRRGTNKTLKVNKFYYKNHSHYKKLKPCHIRNYIPELCSELEKNIAKNLNAQRKSDSKAGSVVNQANIKNPRSNSSTQTSLQSGKKYVEANKDKI